MLAMPLPLAFATVDWIVVAAYLVGVLALGIILSRRERGGPPDDSFTAGRSMPGWTITLSLLATSLSAATFVGAPEQSFGGDLTFLVLYLGNLGGIALVAFVFVPRLYAAKTTTIYGYLATRFGPGSDKAAAVVFLLGRFLASGARLFIAAIPLLFLLDAAASPSDADYAVKLVGCILLIGIVGTLYTMLGGVRAVMWTDCVQLLLVLGALVLSIVLLTGRIDGGLAEVFTQAREAGKLTVVDWSLDLAKPFTVWTALLGNLLFFAAVFGTDYDLAQRFLTARSQRAAVWSTLASQGVGLVTVAAFMLVGLLLWTAHRQGVIAPANDATGQKVYVQFLATGLPPVLAGLAMAGLFAAAQSSMDSAANAMAGVLRSDLLPRDTRLSPKLITLATGAGLIAFATGCALAYDPADSTLIDFALGVLAYAVCPLMGVFLCAFFTRRGTPATVVLSLVVGVALVAVGRFVWPFHLAHWFWHVPVVIAVTFTLCSLVRTPAADLPKP